jgi:excisionase family DNA binding protein
MSDTQKILKALEELKISNSFNKGVLTLNEACAYTSISKSYMYKLTSLNKVPHYNPFGKKLYFNKDELESWLTTGEYNLPQIAKINEFENWAEEILK